ncbi:hypothetical protein [Kordia sp.]|uniref:hypothetical protein n=1 Tax=Kordia sp. TaxID=1965332 RepID=UPI003D6B7C07
MGLDISHYKATFQKEFPEYLPYVGETVGESLIETRETFANYNVPFDHFENYIQIVNCPEILQTAIIVKDAKNLARVENHFRNSDYKIFTDSKQLEKELAIYEAEKNLDVLNRHISSGELSDWKIVSYYKNIQKEGIFFKDVGYQRKRMNVAFWERFCRSDTYCFALEEDFNFAFSCIEKRDDETLEDSQEVIANFKQNFIDNFELGASFMVVSY